MTQKQGGVIVMIFTLTLISPHSSTCFSSQITQNSFKEQIRFNAYFKNYNRQDNISSTKYLDIF